jgi:phosphoenolpyruvate synthase/pyruvate phosphate dikinase
MGRYYNGDIEGKFWFGVQSSTAADQFGSVHMEANYVDYYFDEDNLPDVEKRIEEIEKELGHDKQRLDDFFEGKQSYNDEQIQKALGISAKEVRHILSLYADLELGCKIRDCIKEKGECQFEAEL